jgi:hypothetical protein
MTEPVKIQFALVSHTNNGKTTLARTLVGVDVGEVRDAAHVTSFAESHVLQTSPEGDTLLLWDTPGFGDSVRLLKRLAMAGNPIGWFLREVLDRYRDRTFWLSQQALRAARDEADVVLYLVNSSEPPSDAGYLPAEMRILEWLGKPVVVLLNQLGAPRPAAEEGAEQALWRAHLAQYPIVRDVLALDAFARCWVHEHVFYEALAPLVAPEKSAAYARLRATWAAANLTRYRAALRIVAEQVAQAARDSEDITEHATSLLKSALKVVRMARRDERRQDAAMARLVQRLNHAIAQSTAQLLTIHRLDPGEAGRINARVRDNFKVRAPLDKTQAGLLGAVVSGAATGLSADLMAGGLTLGGAALIGAIVGALTMAGAAWGFNTTTDRHHPQVEFAPAFLRTLLVNGILRYLAVAHFGRGRGQFVEGEAPVFWQAAVEEIVQARCPDPEALWRQVREERDASTAALPVEDVLGDVLADVFERLYPGARATLEAQPARREA